MLCRPDFSQTHRAGLADKLRAITGWHNLSFDAEGALLIGGGQVTGGSQAAREMLLAAISGINVLVIEDASNRADVVFGRVVKARWTEDAGSKPPVYLILIDFADFSHVLGDDAALASFNEGWVLLHEIAHVTHDSVDPEKEDGAGECEALINTMRRECGVAERAEYFFNFFPGQARTEFMTKYVRLAFDKQMPETNKKKRYWIIWDANLVGGLETSKQIASRQ